MTLTETLLANGYTHSKAEHGAHSIYHGRKRVFVGTAPQVWEWLRGLAVGFAALFLAWVASLFV